MKKLLPATLLLICFLLPVIVISSSHGAPTGTTSKFQKHLKGKLVGLNGKRVSRRELSGDPEFYVFYFSAHWCPPCRSFTPKLVNFYNNNDAAGKKFEIIFVSSDNSEDQMEDYIKEDKMPWPAIKYRYAKKIKDINKYAGSGIPCLVMVDREGKIISNSYEGSNYVGPSKVMRDLADAVK
ncbi:MAG: redoxin family protein [Verrucomicrobiales bacterium]|nr:redoxin family protein [Verrucomicrobiales bacterium]